MIVHLWNAHGTNILSMEKMRNGLEETLNESIGDSETSSFNKKKFQ